MPFNKKTGKSKGFDFVTEPDHVFIELSRIISNPVRTGISNTSNFQIFQNKIPKKQNAPARPSIVSVNSSYAKKLNSIEGKSLFLVMGIRQV